MSLEGVEGSEAIGWERVGVLHKIRHLVWRWGLVFVEVSRVALDWGRHEVSGVAMPVPAWLRIVQAGSDVYVYRCDAAWRMLTDTWHGSIAEAREQAFVEYGVSEGDWTVVDKGGVGGGDQMMWSPDV